MSDRFRDLLAAPRPRGARVGKVATVSLADSTCTVLLNEGEVLAYLTDQVWDFVEVGASVTVLPVGETYTVIATQGSAAGSGGVLLGPELIPNGGFEFGDTMPDHWDAFWTAGPATWTRDTTPGEATTGEARALVTLTPTSEGVAANLQSEAIAVDPEATYSASAWVKASAMASNLTVKLNLFTAPTAPAAQPFGDGFTEQNVATLVLPGAAYQLIIGTVTVPAGNNYARLFLSASADAGASLAVSWDEASLRQRITS